jgi:hypothetical protein
MTEKQRPPFTSAGGLINRTELPYWLGKHLRLAERHHRAGFLCRYAPSTPPTHAEGASRLIFLLLVAQFICAAAVIASYEEFVITQPKTYGIFMAVLVFGTIVNIWGNRILELWSKAACEYSRLPFSFPACITLSNG